MNELIVPIVRYEEKEFVIVQGTRVCSHPYSVPNDQRLAHYNRYGKKHLQS